LKDFVVSDNMGTSSELSLLKAVLSYAKDNKMNHSESDVKKEMLPLIRFPLMSIAEITKDVLE
jgi:hypothetical protein